MILTGAAGIGLPIFGTAQELPQPHPNREIILLHSAAGHNGSFDWKMKQAGQVSDSGATISKRGYTASSWSSAIVPGTVLNSLVANGVYPEPYYGVNNQLEQNLIPDISDVGSAFYTYWFRSTFTVPESFANRQVWLQFDGINYKAEIWLNGQKIGDMAGMFNRGLFDITKQAQVGKGNALAILVHPIDPPNGFRQRVDTNGNAQNENRNGADGKIGANVTMLMTCGWDFTFKDGIRDRNTGIWNDIKLFSTGPVLLRNAFVKSELPLPKLTSSKETISVEVRNATDRVQHGILRAVVEENQVAVQQSVDLQPNETKTVTFTPDTFHELEFRDPEIWWPFNKGGQPLYHLQLSFEQTGGVSDELKTRFGIRDIRSDRNTPDKSRMFYVNGTRFFVKGSNWIPEAMCRTSFERTRTELLYTRQSGINFLRFWGGGITESDAFFDLCDELGILIWTEFWQSGDTIIAEDQDLYRMNVTDTVKRIRNHPSLAYYVSANERNAENIVPIEDLIDELDGTRGYQPGSETDGVHDGSPYATCNPMWYYEDTGSPRGSRINGFNPEYGTPILPTIDALREMMDEKDLWPTNKDVWWYLDGDGFHGMVDLYDQAVRQYGRSDGIEEYVWKGQMFGALAYKSLWECWNAQRYDCGERFSSGVLFWYHNSPNRQTCARMWDWSMEPTAALFATQHALEPQHIQYDFIKNTVGVNNEAFTAFRGLVANLRIYNMDMTEVYNESRTLNLPADAFVKDVIKVRLPNTLSPVHFLKLQLKDSSGNVLSDNFYWRSDRPYKPGRTLTGPLFEGMSPISNLPKADVKSMVKPFSEENQNGYEVTVTNPSSALAFMMWIRLQTSTDGKPVRPAFYDDNFFSLLPGETKTVRITYAKDIEPNSTQIIVDGWNINRTMYVQGRTEALPDVRTVKPVSLALNRPAVASSSESSHPAGNVTDLNSSTRWSSDRNDDQWIYVDLGKREKFSQVELEWEAAFAKEYRIQTSNDARTWRDAVHKTDGAGGSELVTFKPVSARYVRMLGIRRATKYGYSLWNMAVYP
ncbi:MAG: discoidin domain-containing protein [Pontiellaceae bacterium]|nr:discoidin domain-containing protein [Pontiellaceae bacterium]MBN2783692.1 discoidin domain-containing protein [Pontiellaceae bacterium]